jgi:hypothetical protein
MSFFCPHFDSANDACLRLKCACVPGRPGCVLRGKVAFAIPAEERMSPSPPPSAAPDRKAADRAAGRRREDPTLRRSPR